MMSQSIGNVVVNGNKMQIVRLNGEICVCIVDTGIRKNSVKLVETFGTM